MSPSPLTLATRVDLYGELSEFKLPASSTWCLVLLPTRIGLMAERAAAASDLAHLDARPQYLKRQMQELKAMKKGDARREQTRTAKTLLSVAICLLALSGTRTEISVRCWRRCGEDLPTVESRTDEVVSHFLAIEPVAMAAILDAKSGPGAVALKKAVAFLLAQETLSWARAQTEGKGIALLADVCSRPAKSCDFECELRPTTLPQRHCS